MSYTLFIFGLFLIIIIQVDIWFTTLTIGGGGPLNWSIICMVMVGYVKDS